MGTPLAAVMCISEKSACPVVIAGRSLIHERAQEEAEETSQFP